MTPAERKYWEQPWTDAELADLGLRPVTEGGRLFCGTRQEPFAINGVTFGWLPGSKITWGLTFSRLGQLSDMDCKDAITEGLKEISACCDVHHEYVIAPDFANLWLTVARMDGGNGVLADCEIPQQRASVEYNRLRMRFDDGEGWVISSTPKQGEIDFYRVFLHEALHAHGLGHKPASVTGLALIAPMYSRTIRNLQPLDIAELVRRMGKPTSVPPITPPPTNPGLGKPVRAIVEQDGKRWEGSIPRVK